MAWLVDFQGRQLALRPDKATRIGRALDNDLVISDTTVSQHHAVISFDDGRAFVRDLDSYNGTFLKGVSVKGGRLISGTEVRFGQVALVYRDAAEAHSVAPLPYGAAAPSAEASNAPPLWNQISGRTVAGLGVGFVVLALTIMHLASGNSTTSSSLSGSENLAAAQDFRLPNATSDFLGDWCGWSRVTSCEPAGSCDEEPMPTSLSFRSEDVSSSAGGVVVLHYQILGSADTEVRDINVQAPDSRHVEVSFTMRVVDSNGLENLVIRHQELVSVNAAAVREIDRDGLSVDGNIGKSEERSTQMEKCSEEFERTQEEYIRRHGMEARGDVKGNVP